MMSSIPFVQSNNATTVLTKLKTTDSYETWQNWKEGVMHNLQARNFLAALTDISSPIHYLAKIEVTQNLDNNFASYFTDDSLPDIWAALTTKFKKPTKNQYILAFLSRKQEHREEVELYIRMKWKLGLKAEMDTESVFDDLINKLAPKFNSIKGQLLLKYATGNPKDLPAFIDELNINEQFMKAAAPEEPLVFPINHVNPPSKKPNFHGDCADCNQVRPRHCNTHFSAIRAAWKCTLCDTVGQHSTKYCKLKCPICFEEEHKLVSYKKCKHNSKIKSTMSASSYSDVYDIEVDIMNVFIDKNEPKASWIFDSGAGCHVACEKNVFTTLDVNRKACVKLPDGHELECAGIGTVDLEIQGLHFLLTDVLFVPTFSNHLISVRKFTVSITFSPTNCVTVPNLEEIGLADTATSLYLAKPNTVCVNTIELSNAETVTPDTILHSRFGHFSANSINKTLK